MAALAFDSSLSLIWSRTSQALAHYELCAAGLQFATLIVREDSFQAKAYTIGGDFVFRPTGLISKKVEICPLRSKRVLATYHPKGKVVLQSGEELAISFELSHGARCELHDEHAQHLLHVAAPGSHHDEAEVVISAPIWERKDAGLLLVTGFYLLLFRYRKASGPLFKRQLMV